MQLSEISGGGKSEVWIGGGGGVTESILVPAAPFANTNYGFDPSEENNYGLGPSFTSTAVRAQQNKSQAARPSMWWLIAFVVIWAVWR